jgi:hypothetical protein
MSTPYTLRRNEYIKKNATCKDCDIKSCATRAHQCPYFMPKDAFTRTMLAALGVPVKGKRRK